MFLGQFAVFAVYGIVARLRDNGRGGSGTLSVADPVATLALVNLLPTPVRNLLYAIPDTFSAVSCLQRIQEYLIRESLPERRRLSGAVENPVMTAA